MGAQNMPAAEVDVTHSLVRALLVEQFPDLAHLTLQELANGWDNVLYRLGDHLTVRLPRRQAAADLVAHEAEWLPQLAPLLPLPVPAPVRVGHPTGSYPWSWTVLPWFDGQPVGTTPLVDPTRAAAELGGFLAALHTPAPGNAPLNPYRGGPLAERADVTLERIERLTGEIDVEAVRSSWEAAAAVPAWTGAPMWIHGDLHPLNLIQRDGELAAVIDFGDITSGDPATDLLVAWELLEEPDRVVFRAAADTSGRPIDDDMWERGRGWAITHALATLAHGADAPALQAIGRRALQAAVR